MYICLKLLKEFWRRSFPFQNFYPRLSSDVFTYDAPLLPLILWWTNILPWKNPPFLMGKSTILWPFSIAVSSPEGNSLAWLWLSRGQLNCIMKSSTSWSGEFRPKKVAAIMGPSGAGKTTFMNALCGRCYYGTAETLGMGWGVFVFRRSDLFEKTHSTGIVGLCRRKLMQILLFK